MIRSLEAWKYLCEHYYVDIPIPKGNETDEELDDYAIGCAYAIEDGLKALAVIKEMLDDDLTEKLNANSRKIFKDIFDNLPKEKQDLLKSVLLY